MSEKRFSPVEGMSSLLVGDNGVALSSVEACDLLNSQAETIEVLREWLRDGNVEMRILVDNAYYWTSQDESLDTWDEKQKTLIVESKRRIAALEGTKTRHSSEFDIDSGSEIW